jgi:hypothetical protein
MISSNRPPASSSHPHPLHRFVSHWSRPLRLLQPHGRIRIRFTVVSRTGHDRCGCSSLSAGILTGVTTATQVPALKEWAVIVHALLEGEQIVDVRKGGLREDGRHFQVAASPFYLYPTTEHQKPELLKPAYRRWIDLVAAAPVGQPLTVPGWAEVVESVTITEPEPLAALDGKLIWSPDYVEKRLAWKRRDPLWVLVLRAYRFDEPITVAWDDAYGGCTSWVDVAGLPIDPAERPSTPALSDIAFAARKKGVDEALS